MIKTDRYFANLFNLDNFSRESSKIIIDIINQPEFQRLKYISFLGFLGDVFDLEKNFSRFDHSIGVYKLGVLISKKFKINGQRKTYLEIACLLHDIGHFPFSHLSEDVILKQFNIDHHKFTEDIITGKIHGMDNIFKILKENGIDPEEIVKIINGTSNYKIFNELFSNSINFDTLDAISRCAFCLNIDYVSPQKFISLFHINSDNEIIIYKKDLIQFDRFWKLKNNIYSNYIYSPENLMKEAMFHYSLKNYLNNIEKENYEAYIKLNDFEIRDLITRKKDTFSSKIFINLINFHDYHGSIIKLKKSCSLSLRSNFSNLYKNYSILFSDSISNFELQKNLKNKKKIFNLYRTIREFKINKTLDLYLNKTNQNIKLSSLNYRYIKEKILVLILFRIDYILKNKEKNKEKKKVKKEEFIPENILINKLKKINSVRKIKKFDNLVRYLIPST
ncbi:HD domain-containing protein [Candidatus Harpocratesius sp.]